MSLSCLVVKHLLYCQYPQIWTLLSPSVVNGTNGFQHHNIMITKPPQLGVIGNYLNSLHTRNNPHLMKTKLIHMLPANELEGRRWSTLVEKGMEKNERLSAYSCQTGNNFIEELVFHCKHGSVLEDEYCLQVSHPFCRNDSCHVKKDTVAI